MRGSYHPHPSGGSTVGNQCPRIPTCRNRRIKTRLQSKTGSLAISAHSASFAELACSGSLARRDSFCSICGFALDTARFAFGCQKCVERTSGTNVPGKSELQIGEIGPVGPEGVKGGIWADGREAVPYGSFGFGRTVPGRVLIRGLRTH